MSNKQDERHKNVRWRVPVNPDRTVQWEGIHAALLMDIRDELQSLNLKLEC